MAMMMLLSAQQSVSGHTCIEIVVEHLVEQRLNDDAFSLTGANFVDDQKRYTDQGLYFWIKTIRIQELTLQMKPRMFPLI